MTRRIRFIISQALTSMIRAPLLQLIAVSTIGAAVMVFCLLQVVSNTTEAFVSNFSGQVGLVVFLKPDTAPNQIDELLSFSKRIEHVRSVQYIEPEKALNELRIALGDARLNMDDIDAKLLPASLQIELDAQIKIGQRNEISNQLNTHHLAENIHSLDNGGEISARLGALSEMVKLFGGLVALLVTIAVLFVISNTMRLAIHAREKEIEIMQWVGAGHLFIRVPFYIEGAIQGAVSALLAITATRLLVEIAPRFIENLPAELQNFRVEPLGIFFETGLLGGLVATGIIASHLATQRYFKKQSALWF
jgi:cell division transport system permease protein